MPDAILHQDSSESICRQRRVEKMDVPQAPTSTMFGSCDSLLAAKVKMLFFLTTRPKEREERLSDPVEN